MRKYVLWKGFYHDFSTKKASASGDFTKGICFLDPRQREALPPDPWGSFAPLNDLPWRHPWFLPFAFSTGHVGMLVWKLYDRGSQVN